MGSLLFEELLGRLGFSFRGFLGAFGLLFRGIPECFWCLLGRLLRYSHQLPRLAVEVLQFEKSPGWALPVAWTSVQTAAPHVGTSRNRLTFAQTHCEKTRRGLLSPGSPQTIQRVPKCRRTFTNMLLPALNTVGSFPHYIAIHSTS